MTRTITTKRLTLRPLGPGDLHTTHAYASDEENTRYMVHYPHKTLEETRAFLERAAAEWRREQPAFYEFAVEREGAHIGGVSVYLFEEHTVGELAWVLRRDACGYGYATEAAEAVRDFALDQLKVRRVVATCDARNGASWRVMERLGLVREPRTAIRRYPDERGEAEELVYALPRDRTEG